MILFPGCKLLAGPKHSTSIPSRAGVAMPLSVEEKEVAFVPGPKPVLALAVRVLFGPQICVEFELCTKIHGLLPFTLQVVSPLMSPPTVHLKVKVSPGQVGGGPVKVPITSPGGKYITLTCVTMCGGAPCKEIVWYKSSSAATSAKQVLHTP